MELTKLNPWNWFKREEETEFNNIPINREQEYFSPLTKLRQDIDGVFENAFKSFDLSPLSFEKTLSDKFQNMLLKPKVDIVTSQKEYSITVEVPGVDENNIELELAGNTLTIKGEKSREAEKKENDVYVVERSYGSFQRILSLPKDADKDNIDAQFKNGVLRISMPRKVTPKLKGKVINIKSAP